MATASSQLPAVPRERAAGDRRAWRRQQSVEEALDHAVRIMSEQGVGALTVSEVARRMGMRGPSLYKYFDSLHALYDALFARGLADNTRVVGAALDGVPPGVASIRSCVQATVRWSVENPALAQLLYWRVVPGFEPTPETFALSQAQMAWMDAMVAEAVRTGEMSPMAGTGEAARLLSVIMSGLITQQMANEPGAGYEDGAFTSMTDAALETVLARYQPTA